MSWIWVIGYTLLMIFFGYLGGYAVGYQVGYDAGRFDGIVDEFEKKDCL